LLLHCSSSLQPLRQLLPPGTIITTTTITTTRLREDLHKCSAAAT
jgi:hypothetical protein